VQPLNKKITAIEIITGNNLCLLILIVYMMDFNYCTISIVIVKQVCGGFQFSFFHSIT
jgi:hypothetical protein